MYGKTLSKLNKKVYVLELGDDRAMAIIIEKDGKKIYNWFWGGSHEDYNKKMNVNLLNKVEANIIKIQTPIINEKIVEMKTSSITDRIEKINKQYRENVTSKTNKIK